MSSSSERSRAARIDGLTATTPLAARFGHQGRTFRGLSKWPGVRRRIDGDTPTAKEAEDADRQEITQSQGHDDLGRGAHRDRWADGSPRHAGRVDRLPALRHDLRASVGQLEWAVNAYNLTFAVLIIAGAAIGDRHGRRRTYAAGIALFTLASAACGLAPDAGALIAARAVQGVGAAMFAPVGLALLTAAFPPERRGAAIGISGAIAGLSVASGPLVGGAIVDGLSWQGVFWINVPFGLLLVPLVFARMRESHGPDTSIDYPGVALITGASLGLVWALVRGGDAGWSSPEVIAALAAGVVLAAGFIAWERRAPSPMLPLRFFSSRAFSAGNTAVFLTFASLFALVFFVAQLLQIVPGQSPRQAPGLSERHAIATVHGATSPTSGNPRTSEATGFARHKVADLEQPSAGVGESFSEWAGLYPELAPGLRVVASDGAIHDPDPLPGPRQSRGHPALPDIGGRPKAARNDGEKDAKRRARPVTSAIVRMSPGCYPEW
jgi:MFS family permease